VVVKGFRTGSPAAYDLDVVEYRICKIGDVIDRYLESLEPGEIAHVFRILSDSEQVVVSGRMDVARVSRNLQLAQETWVGRIAQVEGEEGIDDLEGNHESHVTEEAGRIDLFAGSDASDLTYDVQGRRVLPEDEEVVAHLRGGDRKERIFRGAYS